MRAPLRGLYAIADTGLVLPPALPLRVELALRGGARMIQLRDKRPGAADGVELARALAALCRRYAVPFIVNDDIELARACGADGVHLGRDDPPIGAAREALGEQSIIGISCYDSLERARAAAAGGADYVAFGRFFPSRTKPQAVQAHPSLLRQAREAFDIPLVAIGGITPDNGAALIEAGADLLAVIHGVFGQDDPEAAASAYAALF